MTTFTVKILLLCVLSFAKTIAQLEVGDKCGPNNEQECTLVGNCPEAIDKLEKRQQHGLERCGFKGLVEIVCCSKKGLATRIPLRNSIDACEKFSKTYKIGSGPFIIKGANATPGEFPYMAAVGYPADRGGIKWGDCGGSLISETFVLTAAHCIVKVDGKPPSIVRLGTVDVMGEEKDAPPQDIAVAENIVHPQYKHVERHNDIALIRLQSPAKLSDKVRPVCLNTRPDIPAGLVVAGWGVTDAETEETSRFLQKGLVDLFDLDQCNETYFNSPIRKVIERSQLCALSPDDIRQDTCQGDSGGPIQIENKKDNKETPLVVVGITSYGKGCGSKDPAIYTRVSTYMPWIEGYVFP